MMPRDVPEFRKFTMADLKEEIRLWQDSAGQWWIDEELEIVIRRVEGDA